ncbi:MAG: amidohydrolase family protein [Eubacteriales bacterium]|nr:amidohydrolase family protein [Eubacteriales bacterium]
MKTAYCNGIILDGTKNMVPQYGKTVFVENGIITGIEDTSQEALSGCEVVDLKGKYLLPGLINLHAHLPGSGKPEKKPLKIDFLVRLLTSNALLKQIGYGLVAKNAKVVLMSGVTTVRAAGSPADFDSRVRDDIKRGKRVGPRILTPNCAISVEGGHMAGSFAYIAHSKEEAASLVDKIAEDKPDLIKLMVTGGIMDSDSFGEPGVLRMPPEYIKAACDQAHELGYKVAAHCEGHVGVIEALKNGVDTIEHGCMPNDEIIELFKARNAAHVLTLSPAIPYMKRLPNIHNMTEAAAKNSDILVTGMVALAKKCIGENILLGLGTDSGCTYVTNYDFWREINYFVKYCGVDNAYAIHTATLVNAKIAGIDSFTGSLEVGKKADMIAVEKNPLEDIGTLRNVAMVVFEGRRYDDPKVKKYEEVEKALDSLI